MKRDILTQLKAWQQRKNRKPLILQGARQVGKSWLCTHFGDLCYKHTAYISFNDNEYACQLFEGSYDVKKLIQGLSFTTKTPIIPGDTLIIFDEIQECPRALNALKFFNENAPEYHIIAAGSLLGVALKHHQLSFPVGQVEFLTVHPLSFNEFLLATGNQDLYDLIQEKNIDLITLMGEKYASLLKQYMFVGGMPEAVQSFIDDNDLQKVRDIQHYILTGYQQDFSKYTNAGNIAKISAIWHSIPAQFAKENKKFTFSSIAKSARAREYEDALEWLVLCGLVYKIYNVSTPQLPLVAYQEQSAFKIYMLDSGLLCAMAGVDEESILLNDSLFNPFKGILTEQYACQALKNTPYLPLCYWTNNATAELDFIVQYKSKIIPIEVKSAQNLKAKSLSLYRKKYQPTVSIRASLSPFEINGDLHNIPLYLLGDFALFI